MVSHWREGDLRSRKDLTRHDQLVIVLEEAKSERGLAGGVPISKNPGAFVKTPWIHRPYIAAKPSQYIEVVSYNRKAAKLAIVLPVLQCTSHSQAPNLGDLFCRSYRSGAPPFCKRPSDASAAVFRAVCSTRCLDSPPFSLYHGKPDPTTRKFCKNLMNWRAH